MNVVSQLKQILLSGLTESPQPAVVRQKIADAVAEFAKPGKQTMSWPELLPALFTGCKNSDESIRECSFRIFAAVPTILEPSMADQVAPVFKDAFNDNSEKVKVSAVRAFVSYFRTLPKKKYPILSPLLIDVLNMLSLFQDQGKEADLAATFESIIELAELAPKMFKPNLKIILEFCCSIAQNKEIEINARLSALELLISLADEAPNMCKNEPQYAYKVVYLCLMLMTEVGEDDDDASEWNNEDDVTQSDGNDEVYSAAKHSLDRLALKLGGDSILPGLSEWMPQMLSSSSWRERHAALMALSNVAEGCADIMINQIDKILDMILPLVNDAHPRVQWATLNALGQMSTDFADDMQIHHANRVVPALISKMVPESVPRVQVHAAAAMVNFAENATKETLEPYLDSLLTHLLTLLQSPKRYVIEQVIITIAIVADAAQNKFIKYYDTLMPMLFQFMQTNTEKEYQTLKAKSIECATLIILAVGKEKAQPQFEEIVKIFANIQTSATDPDDPCLPYLSQAWGRLCQVFGKDFVPYLGGVMPPLLATAKANADIHLIENDADVEQLESQEGWEILPIQGKYIGLHTALLDEKAQAINIISIYASILGEDFYPYVEDVVKDVILPSLHFFYNDSVRFSTLQAIPSLITSAEKAVMKHQNVSPEEAKANPTVYNLWRAMFDRLLELLTIEPLIEVIVAAYSCVYQSIEKMYPGVLSEEHLKSLGAKISVTMKEYNDRAVQRQEEDNTYTEDIEEDDSEEIDNELIAEVNKAIHAIFKFSKSAFLPVFETEIAPLIANFLGGNFDQRYWAISVIDDLIEFTGEDSWKFKDLFANHFGDALVNGSSALRQAAAYGIGVAAQHGGDNYAIMCLQNLQPLFEIANAPDARSEENVHAAENASSAISKILRKYGGNRIPADQVNPALTQWVQTLPVYNDDEASSYVHVFLADLMDQNHESVTSQVSKVLESVALALQHEAIVGRTRQRTVEATKKFVSQMPQDQVMSVIHTFSPETQKALQDAFQ